MWYISLDMIPVSINIALYRSSVIWLFIFSVIFLGEPLRIVKVVAVAIALCGVVLVAWGNLVSGGIGKNNDVVGYVLVLASAFLFACFECLYRRAFGKANTWGVLLNQSLEGLFVLVALWPLIPLYFYVFHVEPVVYFTPKVTEYLFVNAAFAVTYYLLYAFGKAFISNHALLCFQNKTL